MNLIWDDWNIDHIAKHGIIPKEVEEAVRDRHRVRLRLGTSRFGLKRYKIIGCTKAGRYLRVLLDLKKEGFYVVTSYDAPDSDIRLYRRRRN